MRALIAGLLGIALGAGMRASVPPRVEYVSETLQTNPPPCTFLLVEQALRTDEDYWGVLRVEVSVGSETYIVRSENFPKKGDVIERRGVDFGAASCELLQAIRSIEENYYARSPAS